MLYSSYAWNHSLRKPFRPAACSPVTAKGSGTIQWSPSGSGTFQVRSTAGVATSAALRAGIDRREQHHCDHDQGRHDRADAGEVQVEIRQPVRQTSIYW